MDFDACPYEPLTLENLGGRPITVKDFVMRVHAHLKERLAFIMNYRKTMGFNTFYDAVAASANGGVSARERSLGPRLFVKEGIRYIIGGKVVIGVPCFLEDEIGTSAETFFECQRTCAACERAIRFAAQERTGRQ